MIPQVKRKIPVTHKLAATNARTFRTFLLMEQFAAQEIGQRIARARHEADGLTQEQLADLIGVSTRSVQGYEAGAVIPWKHIRAIAAVTRVPVEWLIHGDEDDRDTPDSRELLSEMDERLRRIERLLQERPPEERAGS